jgi:trk system potassium uptake protein
MKHLIIGAGYFGQNLAIFLAKKGEEVIVIDKSMEKITPLRDIASSAMQLDATDKEMLRRIVTSDLDQAVVCIGSDVASSLIVTLILKELGVKNIIGKCHSKEHEKILRMMGIETTIDPEKQMAEHLADRLVEPNIIDFLPLEAGYQIIKANPPKQFHAKQLKDIALRNKYSVNIIGIKKRQKDGTFLFNMTPGGDTIVEPDDIIIAVGKTGDIDKIFK